MIEFEPAEMDWTGFSDLLNADMRIDLPNYLDQYASDSITIRSIEEIVAYNYEDSAMRIPYGQGRFERILTTNISEEGLDSLRTKLRVAGKNFFESAFAPAELDFVLSINNWNAGNAAAANYPCLTIPMGYKESGEPINLTFISRPFKEDELLKVAYAFEQATQVRKMPEAYQ